MKKSMITLILTITLTHLFGQETLKNSLNPKAEKKALNEFGVDMTPFIKFYLNFSNNYFNYDNNYMLTYRRYFKKSNFRSAIGGNYNYSKNESPFNYDSLNEKYFNKQSSVVLRIGYEFYQNLSNRWQVFYGADLITNYSHQKNDAQYWNGGYANGIESTTKGIGVAPLLGLRFKMNNRISLITESSFLLQYSTNSKYRYYLPVSASYPPISNEPIKRSKSIGTQFNYPIAIVITFNL